jgi:hypothetical protein
MNERIKELISLADVRILPDDSEYGHCIIGLEKFAELIVKDCASVVDGVYKAGGNTYSNLIYERFGIKYDWQE